MERQTPAPYCEDIMTLIGILGSLTLVIVIGVVVCEYVNRRRYRQGKAVGCTCPAVWVWRQDCPRHGWIEAGYDVTDEDDGGNVLEIDENGIISWHEQPERDPTE